MRTHTYLLALFTCLLMLASKSMAQPYTLRHLGIEDGLSNNYVTNIIQDSLGCIWIATEAGLNRFNGKDFTVYNTHNSNIAGDALTRLLYDREENKLWVGTKTGISLLDCKTQEFEHSTPLDSIDMNNNIVSISPAADGGIWIANHYGKIVHYNKKKGKATSFSGDNIKGLPHSHWTVFDNGKGQLYVGHAGDGMSIIDLKSGGLKRYQNDPHNPKSLPGSSVYSICIDHLENIWIGTNQGLALYNPVTEDFQIFRYNPAVPTSLISDHVYEIKEMQDNRLWIATDIGGISILDLRNITFMNPKDLKFQNITNTYDKQGLSSGNIRSLFQDSFGNIWIGNYSSGVDFISHMQPVFHTLPYMIEKGQIIKYKSVWGIDIDEKQQVWLGSENEIALFKDGKLQKKFDLTAHLSRSYAQVFTMHSSKENLFLGLYDDGLLKFNIRTNRIDRLDLGQDYVDVNALYEDENGKLWIGMEYGLASYEKGILRKEHEINSQISNLSVYSILHDRQGKLWIGSYGSGIFVFDNKNKCIAQLISENGFCSNSINQLYMDTEGGIWAATRNGIGYIKDTNHPESFIGYQYEDGLEDTYIHALQEDKAGNIWFSTDKGISCWNREQDKFDNYDYRDGVPLGSFIDGSTHNAQDGTLYFGSLNGVCYFNPQDISKEAQVASVKIVECKGISSRVEDRSDEALILSNNGTIELTYDRNSFRITFMIPDYSQSQVVEYAYMIEELGNTWTNTQGENQVTFRNLSPGKYTFKVKARLRNHDWDDNHIATMKIHIHPPLWLTWYAKVLYSLLIVLGIYIWFRFYKRKLMLENSLELERKKSQNEQELNNERLRFYTNITHELRTPLTLILGPLEDLINDSNLPIYYSNKVKVIHSSAIRLLNLINQILEFRKTETQNRKLTVAKSDLGSLVTEIGLRYKELNRNEKVKFHIQVQPKEAKLYFDADIISTILNNLLSNAIKYTPEGEIKLMMHPVDTEENRYMEIVVNDTGYGIDADALPHIFDRYYQAKGKHQASGTGIGLALVKSLADLHEGILYVESEVGKGTTFTFRILTENTYPDALHKEEKETITQTDIEKTEEEREDTDIRPMVLVVEDNDDIREYITTSFSNSYRILSATNGKEGLEQAQQYIPDIIISDIMMPVMDGIELCKLVKEDVCTSHIPIILLTAKDSIQDKEEGYESGADSYLTKPFSAKLLHSRVHNLLESRKKLARLITSRTKELKPEQSQESMKLNRLDEEFLNRFTAIVEENIDTDQLDMPFMMDKMNMSHSTLYRKIKGLTGISGNEFIRKIRLKNSLRLLMEEGLNVSEAAYASGFNDLGYFRTCFKEEYGMAPSEYMKQQKEQELLIVPVHATTHTISLD